MPWPANKCHCSSALASAGSKENVVLEAPGQVLLNVRCLPLKPLVLRGREDARRWNWSLNNEKGRHEQAQVPKHFSNSGPRGSKASTQSRPAEAVPYRRLWWSCNVVPGQFVGDLKFCWDAGYQLHEAAHDSSCLLWLARVSHLADGSIEVVPNKLYLVFGGAQPSGLQRPHLTGRPCVCGADSCVVGRRC